QKDLPRQENGQSTLVRRIKTTSPRCARGTAVCDEGLSRQVGPRTGDPHRASPGPPSVAWIADGSLTALASGKESFDDFTAAGGRVVFSAQDATHALDLHAIDAAGRRRLTTLNPQLARFRLSAPESFDFWSADGERLAALLYKPVGFDPARPAPVITYVYEKMTPQAHRFSAQYQVFLNHGFAMLLPNVKVKTGATATSFVKCVVPAVNAVRAMGVGNGRFGLWGGSFGAYATSYLITQTDIFAAAVSRATPPELHRNWASGRDRDSRNIESGQARMGGSPFEHPERYLSQSAFFHLDKVSTPVLIVHGERDTTIPAVRGCGSRRSATRTRDARFR
ncbi:MAG: alpha/beta hydrolase family protein, partial [Candidatus Rokuibacteriota bacterium]